MLASQHQRTEKGKTPSKTTSTIGYYLRSSVLGGQVITEYNGQGSRQNSYIYAGTAVLAAQTNVDTGTPQLVWRHINPVTGDGRDTDGTGRVTAATHLDPEGVDVGTSDPFDTSDAGDPSGDSGGLSQSRIDQIVAQLIPGFGGPQVKLDGIITSPALAYAVLASGAGMNAPAQTVYGIYSHSQGRYVGLAVWNQSAAQDGVVLFGRGSTGFLPAGTSYQQGAGLSGANVTQWLANYSLGAGPHQDFISTKALQVLALIAGPPNLVPLPNRTNNNLINATNALASKLASGVSGDCQKNVIDKLKGIGFDLNGFINFLGNNPQFYNGVTSQALAAGTVSPKQPADILYGPGATIADVFKGSGNTRPNALTSITSPTFLSFFRPDAIRGSGTGTQSLIFHEGIHGFTGKVDADIQGALGIKQTSVSQNITDYIRKHCF